MKRNKHSLSHYRLVTADMGKLIPVGCFEVLPGDTVQQATSMLVRVSPLLAPVMHPVSIRVHHWFVPYRLLWENWEDFITGGYDGLGAGSGPIPTYTTGTGGVSEGSVSDYLGVPTGVENLSVNAFPLNAYVKIFNEFYRDQDLVPEITPGSGWDGMPLNVSWEKDYFTASRPWAQKGPDVILPLGQTAPVIGTGDLSPRFKNLDNISGNIQTSAGTGANVTHGAGTPTGQGSLKWDETKLVADLATATGANINDIRLAFALQRYQEARAQYGSRYTEYLRYLGVRSSDARLQRPEYLGGGKQTISFSEVLQTAPATDSVVGELKGHGIAGMRSRRYRRFFEEHGVVLSLMSARPRTIYTNGLHRMWSRRTKEDFWQKELEQIGQQEVFQREVFATDNDTTGGTVFGYNDRYAEYKHIPSTIHGEFRSILDFWHLGRDFAAPPALNRSFIECDPAKRIFAEQTTHSLWCMVSNNIQARRLVRSGSNSRVM